MLTEYWSIHSDLDLMLRAFLCTVLGALLDNSEIGTAIASEENKTYGGWVIILSLILIFFTFNKISILLEYSRFTMLSLYSH